MLKERQSLRHANLAFLLGPMRKSQATFARFIDDEAQTGVEAGAADQQPTGEEGIPLDQVNAADSQEPQNTEEQGQLQALQAEREKRQAVETQLMQMQQVLMQQQQPQQPSNQKTGIAAYMEREGIGKDGYITPEDMLKVAKHFDEQAEIRTRQSQQEQWFASHPDYVGTVTTPTGGVAEPLMEAIKQDPALGIRLRQKWDPNLAYYAAMAVQKKAAPAASIGEQIRTGQKAPQGISAASGGGGSMDRVSSLQGMSQTEFEQKWRSGEIQRGFT